MAELQAGKVFVDLVPRLEQGFGRGVEKELDGPLGRIRNKAAGIGKAVSLGIAGGVAGGGALLLGAANELDGAFDTIRLGTGAVGEDLEDLKQSFRTVAGDSASSMEEVSTAIADLNTRTGQTGPGLETIAAQLLDLSRITETDVATNIAATTRLFGDWGVAVDDQADTLDYLFRVSQATGIGVSDLSDQMVKFGAPLRQLGFGMEESAALLGKFEKEGVNAGLVMGSMRVALGKMARAGEAPVETLARVTDEIKNAGSTGEANALALEVFGARAGPDMAAAIREGRFEVDDLVKTLTSGGDTIRGVAAETDDFGEKFQKLKNRAILAAEPLANRLFDALNSIADAAGPVVSAIGERLPDAFESIRKAVTPVVDAVGEVFSILFRGDFTGKGPWSEDSEIVDGLFDLRDLFLNELLPAMKAVGDFIGRNLKPILAVLGVAVVALVSPFALVVGALLAAYVRFEGFREVVAKVIEWLKVNVPPAFEAVRAAAEDAWRWIEANVIPIVETVVGLIVEHVGRVAALISENWDTIAGIFSGALTLIFEIVDAALGLIQWLWGVFGEEILEILRIAWDLISGVFEAGLKVIEGLIDFFVAIFQGKWGDAWDALLQILSGVWDAFYDVVVAGGRLIGQALEIVLSVLREIWDGAFEGMKAVLSGLWDGLTDAARAALNGMLDALETGINLAIRMLNTALDGIDKAAGPWVNFGEVPEVTLPRLARGGTARNPGLSIVGDGGNGSGAELLAMPRGAAVVPLRVGKMIAEAALAGAGAGGTLIDVDVDARGIEDPAAVGDYTARHLAWRLSTDGNR